MTTLGFNPNDFGTHSLRRGGATQAYHSGASAQLIKLHGGWSSTAYESYTIPNIDTRLQLPRLIQQTLIND